MMARVTAPGRSGETSRSTHVLEVPYRSPLSAFAPFRDAPMSLLLHGCGDHPEARWSYLLIDPPDVFSIGARPTCAQLYELEHWLEPRATPDAGLPPFCGGVAGFFAYEFGGVLERAMPRDLSTRIPCVALGRCDCIAAFDNVAKKAFIVAALGGAPENSARAASDLASRLGFSRFAEEQPAGSVDAIDSAAAYESQVRHVVDRIRAGDLFQANISRRFCGTLGPADHPYSLFARLCRISPAPFCAYLRLPDAAIVSNSPERFVSLRPTASGLVARTSPIKGTRPRGCTPTEDASLSAELVASEKDRAENLMIVDLMRNDISRVSTPGSVRVPQLFAVETFANVHHLVSTVEGRLKPGLGSFDLMRAAFPAGSITGAPKIKAMEVIHSIERAPREANYGSIAWFGSDGAMDTSVLIRTATCFREGDSWRVEFRVGGGIVADSVPAEEARETETKALSLLRAIGDRN